MSGRVWRGAPSEPWTFAIDRAPRTASRPTMARLGMGATGPAWPQPQDEETVSRRRGSSPGEGLPAPPSRRGRCRQSSKLGGGGQGGRGRLTDGGHLGSSTQETAIRERGRLAGPCRTSRFGAARHHGSETDERVGRFPRRRAAAGAMALAPGGHRLPGNRPRARTVSRGAEAAREVRVRRPAATQNRAVRTEEQSHGGDTRSRAGDWDVRGDDHGHSGGDAHHHRAGPPAQPADGDAARAVRRALSGSSRPARRRRPGRSETGRPFT